MDFLVWRALGILSCVAMLSLTGCQADTDAELGSRTAAVEGNPSPPYVANEDWERPSPTIRRITPAEFASDQAVQRDRQAARAAFLHPKAWASRALARLGATGAVVIVSSPTDLGPASGGRLRGTRFDVDSVLVGATMQPFIDLYQPAYQGELGSESLQPQPGATYLLLVKPRDPKSYYLVVDQEAPLRGWATRMPDGTFVTGDGVRGLAPSDLTNAQGGTP